MATDQWAGPGVLIWRDGCFQFVLNPVPNALGSRLKPDPSAVLALLVWLWITESAHVGIFVLSIIRFFDSASLFCACERQEETRSTLPMLLAVSHDHRTCIHKVKEIVTIGLSLRINETSVISQNCRLT